MADLVARGVRFNIQQLGTSGPVAVFVHGFVFDNMASWYLTAASALAPTCRVVLYDQRGHGFSEQPPTGYAVGDLADDLEAILDELGYRDEPIRLVGNSAGAHIALVFAIRNPRRVARLLLVDPEVGPPSIGDDLAEVTALEGSERLARTRELFLEWADQHRGERDGAYLTKLVGERSQKRSQMGGKTHGLVYETSFADDIGRATELQDDELARIDCPVLLLYGEGSPLLAQGRRLVDVLPDCRLELVPGVEHFLLIHARDRVREALRDWLAAP